MSTRIAWLAWPLLLLLACGDDAKGGGGSAGSGTGGSGVGGSGGGGAPPGRSSALGFQPWPYDATIEAVDWTWGHVPSRTGCSPISTRAWTASPSLSTPS